MPRKKENKEFYSGNEAPKHWGNNPDNYLYIKDTFQVTQKDLDSLPEVTVSSVRHAQDVDRIIKWINENSLSGRFTKWEKIMGHTFIELLKIDTEEHKKLFKDYKESMTLKLENAIKILKQASKNTDKYIKSLEKDFSPTLFGIINQTKRYPDFINNRLEYYKERLKDIKSQHIGQYIFIKPHLRRLLEELSKDGKIRISQQEKVIYTLFKIFGFNDFDKIDVKSGKERVRALLYDIKIA